MRAHARSVALVIASAFPWMAACVGGGDDSFVPAPPADASLVDGSHEAAATDGTTGRRDAPLGVPGDGGAADATMVNALPGPLAGLRVAQWSPGAPPVDYCVAAHGSGVYQGPVLRSTLGDAADGGIAFPNASAYSLWPPGKYDVRLVGTAPGTDCTPTGFPEPPGTILGRQATATLALLGEVGSSVGDAGLTILQLVDDFVVLPDVSTDGAVTDMFAVRFLHAVPGFPPVDLVGTTWSFKGVRFRHENPWMDGGTDDAGYQRVPAGTPATIHVRLSGQDGGADAGPNDLFPPPTVSALAGNVLTFVLAGTTPMASAVQLVECIDNAGTQGPDSACRTLTVSTCGNGIMDPFEDCDCGSGDIRKCPSANPGMDTTSVGNSDNPMDYSPCSTTCRLN